MNMDYRKFYDLLGMIKFSHTLFALPFALLGAALAAKGPEGWRGRWLGDVAIAPMPNYLPSMAEPASSETGPARSS
jgi:hypothetical protein